MNLHLPRFFIAVFIYTSCGNSRKVAASLNTDKSSVFNSASLEMAAVIVPDTFAKVRAISIIGSIAKIMPINAKCSPMPIPAKTIVAATVAVPGIPAIPTEPIVTTITNIM